MTCLLPQLHILSSIAYSFEQYGNYLSFHERAFLFFYSVLPPPSPPSPLSSTSPLFPLPNL